MITYSKLRGKLFNKKAQTLSNLIFSYHQKHSLKREISLIEVKYILSKIVKNNKYFSYLNKFDEITKFIIEVKRNEVDINKLEFPQEKKEALIEILDNYNNFLKEKNLADIADIEKFVFQNIDEKYEVDEFENENIHFFESFLQKKILEKITKTTLNETILNKNTSIKTIESFDEFDEVVKTFKIIKNLLDDGVNQNDIKIFATDVDKYFKIFETLAFEYKIPVYSSKGLEIKRYNKGRMLAKQKAKFLYQKLSKFGIEVNLDDIEKELLNERILNKKGIEITETNQVFLHNDIKHLFLVGANIENFPPNREKNIFYTKDYEKLFFKNNLYTSSKAILERMKNISSNMYAIHKKDNLSVLLDEDKLDEIFKYNSKKENISKSYEKTPYDLLHTSVSQINTYTKCPKRYFYGYVLGLKAPQEEKVEMEITLKGSIMHKAFEIIVNEKIEDIDEIIKKSYEDEEIKKELKNDIYEELFKIDLKSMIVNFLEYIKDIDTTNSKTEYTIYLDETLQIIDEENPKNYFFKGIIDRIDIDEEIKIIDYKSSDSKKKEEFLAGEKIKDIQLGLYTYWAKQKYDKPILASLISFKKGFKEFVKMADNKEDKKAIYYDNDYKNILKNHIFKSVKNIKNGEFDYIEEPDCKYCDFRKICKSENIQKEEKF